MEKFIESLNAAVKDIRIADHMIYITFPVIKDKRLLLQTMDHIYQSLINTINAILQYDYVFKRIQLSKNPKDNFDTFITKCARRFNITSEEISDIMNFLTIVESHKKSPMEFIRHEKIVIMSENLSTNIIDQEKIKNYLNLTKRILEKARFVIKTS